MPELLEFSVIVPVYNEASNVDALVAEIATTLDGRSYEMIFVDDASSDETKAALISLKPQFPALRVLSHRQNAGQSRAIRTGVTVAKGRIIGTLDGDGQNDPADLPKLYRQLTRADAPPDLGLVIGERVNRRDGLSKRVASRLGNAIRRTLFQDENKDSACGIKVIRREVFLALPYFDHMHRYMPALVQTAGLDVETQSVSHRPRKSGTSKYTNTGRAIVGLRDMLGVAWLADRHQTIGHADEA